MRRLAPVAAVLALAACGAAPSRETTVATTATVLDPPLRIVREPADPTVGLDDSLHRATTTTARASRSRPRTRGLPSAPAAANAPARAYGVRTVSSTAYCLTGTMANGQRVFNGAVAMNGVPLGSRWLVHSGPEAGRTLTVADRIGHGSQFDVAYPGDCARARNYGRRTITVERVS